MFATTGRTRLPSKRRPNHHSPVAWKNLTILIHGYNNDMPGGGSYQQFLANMRQDTLDEAGDIVEFYWPGDKWNFLGYGIAVLRATLSGQRLQKFLAAQFSSAPLHVTIIAHSLGCRVALETIAAANAKGKPQFAALNLCLMAAAVPIGCCEKWPR